MTSRKVLGEENDPYVSVKTSPKEFIKIQNYDLPIMQ